jgi:multidrug efflux system membrane fusion protein
VTVPAAAVQRGPDGLYAYVVAPDGTAQKRTIDVGQIAEGKAVIAKGVEAGERVVTAGQYRVQEGARLDVRDGGGGAAAGNSTGSGDRGGDETAAAAGAGSSSK